MANCRLQPLVETGKTTLYESKYLDNQCMTLYGGILVDCPPDILLPVFIMISCFADVLLPVFVMISCILDITFSGNNKKVGFSIMVTLVYLNV